VVRTLFGGGPKASTEARVTAPMDDSVVQTTWFDRSGTATARSNPGRAPRMTDAWMGGLSGDRSIVASPQGMSVGDRQSVAWGFWRKIGRFFGARSPKKRVTAETTQTTDGEMVTFRGPRATRTRTTRVTDGTTISNGAEWRRTRFARTQRIRETDTVVASQGRVDRRADSIRAWGFVRRAAYWLFGGQNETVKKVTWQRLIADGTSEKGARQTMVERRRLDGTTRRIDARASRRNEAGQREFLLSSKGSSLGYQVGRVDGHLVFRVQMPLFGWIGTRTEYTPNQQSGRIEAR
jgi:hypothetical protein